MGSVFAAFGALNGALAIIAAAFGAHALKGRLATGEITDGKLSAFETGAEHHLYHAIALVLVGLALRWRARGGFSALDLAGWLFITGTTLFAGSLYLYGTMGLVSLMWLTPIGGLLNVTGWLALAFGLVRMPTGEQKR